MKNLVPVALKAHALLLQKNYIRHGIYRYNDPFIQGKRATLKICKCGGFSDKVNDNPARLVADEKTLTLSTIYSLECTIKIDKDKVLYPTAGLKDWPRSAEGRDFLEDTFLSHVNYFSGNIVYISANKNKEHQHLNSVRPVGSLDIISISFALNGKVCAAQGNTLQRLLLLGEKEDAFWPKTTHVTRSFGPLPAEGKLLLRACSLVNYGFYQEAILVSFSVLDAKLQELVETRASTEYGFEQKDVKRYLRNISQERLVTVLDFLLKCMDGTSIKEGNPKLLDRITRLNSKRNSIIHGGTEATRDEAKLAIFTVIETLLFINSAHKGTFDIPEVFLNKHRDFMLF